MKENKMEREIEEQVVEQAIVELGSWWAKNRAKYMGEVKNENNND
jgi:hypothetical protein